MTEILDLRQSSRSIAAFNERVANRYRTEPDLVDLVDLDRAKHQALASRSTGWLIELLRLAADTAPDPLRTSVHLHLTGTALTCSFAISHGFIERLFTRTGTSASHAPDSSLALLMQISRRPQFFSSQGSVLFAPSPPTELEPEWLSDMDFGPMSFARPIGGFIPGTTTDDADDHAKVLLSTTADAASSVLTEIRSLNPEYLGLIDGEVDLTLLDDTRGTSVRVRKYQDTEGRYWVSVGDGLERPLEVLKSADQSLTWSVLENSTGDGHLCGYLPTNSAVTIPGLLSAPWEPDDNNYIPRTPQNVAHILGLARLVRTVARTKQRQHLLEAIEDSSPTDSWADRLLRRRVGMAPGRSERARPRRSATGNLPALRPGP